MSTPELEQKFDKALEGLHEAQKKKHDFQHPPPKPPEEALEAEQHLQQLQKSLNEVLTKCKHTIQLVKEQTADVIVLTDVTAVLSVLASSLADLHTQLTQEYEAQKALREKEHVMLDKLNKYLEDWV